MGRLTLEDYTHLFSKYFHNTCWIKQQSAWYSLNKKPIFELLYQKKKFGAGPDQGQ